VIDGRRIESRGRTGWFEDEPIDLGDRLPEGSHRKDCLACFRGNQGGYRQVDTKEDLLAVGKTLNRFVQETDLCPEHESRRPGTGCRG